MLLKPENMHLFIIAVSRIKATFLRKETDKHFQSKSNVIFSVFLFSQNFTQLIKTILQIFNPWTLALNIGQTWVIPIILFSTAKQNPADKQYMPQKYLQLNTVAAYMCCSQPGQFRQSNFLQKIQKTVGILPFRYSHYFSYFTLIT